MTRLSEHVDCCKDYDIFIETIKPLMGWDKHCMIGLMWHYFCGLKIRDHFEGNSFVNFIKPYKFGLDALHVSIKRLCKL